MQPEKQSKSVIQRQIPVLQILQLNNQDLNRFIRSKEQENPLIELRGLKEGEDGRMSDVRTKLAWLDATDEQNRVYYETDLEEETDREEWNIPVESRESLSEFVMSQLSSSCGSDRDREILTDLAESLDSRGYLTESAESLRKRFGLREVDAYRYLYLLQSVEPAGVGARNLVECLLLQLDRMPAANNIARRIVIECLDLLGEKNSHKIAARLGTSVEEVERSADIIRHLNPKPGSGFSLRENLRYILPDVTVVKFRDYFQVLLGDNAYPQIRISRYYRQLLERPETDPEAVAYIEAQLRNVEDIRYAIAERGRILGEVTRAVVEYQREFFEKGAGYRRSLSYREVAAILHMEETMVAQAVMDKYLQCTWGIYPLNYFFPSPAINGQGESVAGADRVKECICEIIAGEDKNHPLSDRMITELLEKKGFAISRRTVAKYRSMMKIPDAGGRRDPGPEIG